MFSCMQQLANQSAIKSPELREVEEGLQLVVDKERRLDEKMKETVELCNKLDKIKLEQGQKNQLLKEEIANLTKDKKALEEKYKSLQEKNKLIVKNHKGNSLSLLFLDCKVVELVLLSSIRVLILVA